MHIDSLLNAEGKTWENTGNEDRFRTETDRNTSFALWRGPPSLCIREASRWALRSVARKGFVMWAGEATHIVYPLRALGRGG